METLTILSVLVLYIRLCQCMEDKEMIIYGKRNDGIANFDRPMRKCSCQCGCRGTYCQINRFSPRIGANGCLNEETPPNTERRLRNDHNWTTIFQRSKLPMFYPLTPNFKDAKIKLLSKNQNYCRNQDLQFLSGRTPLGLKLQDSPKRAKADTNAVSSLTYQGAYSPPLSQLATRHNPLIMPPSSLVGSSHHPIPRASFGRVPFCNVAHLKSSVGCSGLVITPHHILTAAHCVHDGYNFDRRLRKMHISVSSVHGFENRRLLSVHVPRRWLNSADGGRKATAGRTDSERAIYDFAVIELDRDINISSHCPRNGTSGKEPTPASRHRDQQLHRLLGVGTRSTISFTSFPASGEHRMWQTTCSTLDQSAASVHSGLLATTCPSMAGSSGAAVFARSSATPAQPLVTSSSLGDLIGLVSHEARITNNRSYMVITVLSQKKRSLICAMTGANVHNFCTNTMPNKYRFISYSLHRTRKKAS